TARRAGPAAVERPGEFGAAGGAALCRDRPRVRAARAERARGHAHPPLRLGSDAVGQRAHDAGPGSGRRRRRPPWALRRPAVRRPHRTLRPGLAGTDPAPERPHDRQCRSALSERIRDHAGPRNLRILPIDQTMTRDIKDLIVALDIGTSKVVAVVAEILPDGGFEVLGLGQHESEGMRKGVVVNIESTVNSIQRALEEAELMADCKIREVYTGIAGSHITSFNSSGMVAVKDKEVTATDVARVIETAKAVNIPTDQQVLHVL